VSDRATKAELVAEITEKDERITELLETVRAWQNARLTDDEAEAISGAVRALDKICKHARQYGYGEGRPNMRRVIRYLADRYSVEWYDPPPISVSYDTTYEPVRDRL
jgi:hypothetical protein